LVFYAASDYEAVAGASVEGFACTGDFEVAGDYIDDLFVGMAVGCADPSFLHAMLRQKQFVVVGTHQAREARLRGALLGLIARDHNYFRRGIHRVHIVILP
jgi:hypothetical protein